MNSQRRFRRLIAIVLSAVALAMRPSALAAQQNNPNTTGLPMYSKLTLGSEYPSMKTKEGTFRIYSAKSSDELSVVENWYRHALKNAVESKDDDQMTHGIKLTVGKDRVLVYQLGKYKGTVVELQKYLSAEHS